MGVRTVLRRLGSILDKPAPEEPGELAREREMLKAAFRAAPWPEAAPPVRPAGQADAPAPGQATGPRDMLPPVPAPGTPFTLAPRPTTKTALPTPEAGTAPHRSAPVESNPERATTPESLLRPPANAAVIADDFFDGLVRRVEGHDRTRER